MDPTTEMDAPETPKAARRQRNVQILAFASRRAWALARVLCEPTKAVLAAAVIAFEEIEPRKQLEYIQEAKARNLETPA